MAILQVNMEENQELRILADDTEAQLRVVRAEVVAQNKNPARSNLALTFDSVSDPLVDDIRVWLPVPDAAEQRDEPKSFIRQENKIKEFMAAIGITIADTDIMVGKEFWAVIREEEGLNGSPQNSVKRYIAQR